MAFRRRRIQVLSAKCQSDGVESAFRRQNGDPTRSNQRFPGKMAIRRAGEARFFDRMPIRRGGIGIFLTECRFDGGGSGVFLAEGRFDAGGTDVFSTEGRFDRGERAFRWRKGGLARRGVTFRRVEAGSPPGQWRPPLQTGFPHRGSGVWTAEGGLSRQAAVGFAAKGRSGHKGTAEKIHYPRRDTIKTNGIRVLRRPIRAGSCLFVV